MTEGERGTILVTGATGRQGGAVARHLLANGFPVRAATRNPDSSAAGALRAKGAEVVAADMRDPATLERALEGVSGVFSVQNFWEAGVGYLGEMEQGKNVADAAKRAGVRHFVQSVIAGVDKPTRVEHFDSKLVVEQHIRAIGLPATMLGTVFFYENFLDPKTGKSTLPILAGELKRTTRLHMMAVEDVGRAAAVIFANPDLYIGKTVNLAGDRLGVEEMRQTYQRVLGKEPSRLKLPFLTFFLSRDFWRQLRWNNQPGWQFSLDETRQVIPDPITFERFLRDRRPDL